MYYETYYIADPREREARARRIGVRRLLSGLLVFVASLVVTGFLPPRAGAIFGWIGTIPGAYGLVVAFDAIALLVNPARLDRHSPVNVVAHSKQSARAEPSERSLPPAIAYGILFAAAGILFGVLAYMIYFQD